MNRRKIQVGKRQLNRQVRYIFEKENLKVQEVMLKTDTLISRKLVHKNENTPVSDNAFPACISTVMFTDLRKPLQPNTFILNNKDELTQEVGVPKNGINFYVTESRLGMNRPICFSKNVSDEEKLVGIHNENSKLESDKVNSKETSCLEKSISMENLCKEGTSNTVGNSIDDVSYTKEACFSDKENCVCDGRCLSVGESFDLGSDRVFAELAASAESFEHKSFHENTQYDINSFIELKEWAIKNRITHIALKELLNILREKGFHDLPTDPRSLLNTPRCLEIEETIDGRQHYFGIKNGLAIFLKHHAKCCFSDQNIVTMSFNIDGIPLYRNSNIQFWPILGMVINGKHKLPFVVSLFCGKSKPSNVDSFLKDFIIEYVDLVHSGLTILNKHYIFDSSGPFVCDAPARSFVKCIQNHNAYHGCEKCTIKGVWNRKVTMPSINNDLRTDSDFENMIDLNHHKRKSPLARLPIGLVSQFPLDYMHLVLLGVMKQLLKLWVTNFIPKRNIRLNKQQKMLISKYLFRVRKFIPSEFSRKPRSLEEFEKWKATELRLFLLYIGPVCLESAIHPTIYANFMLLSCSIRILVEKGSSVNLIDYASTLLKQFIIHFGKLYGNDQLVYNIHNLVHLPEDVKKYGPLDDFSAFHYESCLGILKRMIRSGNEPLSQIQKRITEIRNLSYNKNAVSADEDEAKVQLSGKHSSGPLLDQIEPVNCQYKRLKIDGITFSTDQQDSVCSVDGKVFQIKNIVETNSDLYFIGAFFNVQHDAFKYPMPSSLLNIYETAASNTELNAVAFRNVAFKYFFLPCFNSSNYVVLPIIHSTTKFRNDFV